MNTSSKEAVARVMASGLPQESAQLSEVDGEMDLRHWTTKEKCAIACFTLLSGFVASFGTPIYIAAIPKVAEDFHLGETLAIAPVSLYAYGLGIGALLGTATCEVFGRRIVYRVAVPLSLLFTILGGSAKNLTTVAVARSLAGTFSGPCLTVGVGVLNDMWDVSLEKTGTTFVVLFAMSIIWATLAGPMASASLLTYHSWRWTFWCSAIMVGITAITAFLIPETYMPQILRNRVEQTNVLIETQRSSLDKFLISVGRPLHMILVEPIILPCGLVMAVMQAVVFAYYVAYTILFEDVYGFSQYQVGMAFGPLVIGSILAVPILALFDRTTYQKARAEALQSGTTIVPETRLYPAMLGSILSPVSLFWLAWTGHSGVHWIVPTLSGVPFGLAYVLNMLCLPVYMNDVYRIHYGASVLAASTFMRFIVSSSFPLFTAQMVHSLGFPWAVSLLGFITVALIPVPWVFFKWGPSLRKRSQYLKD